MLEMAMGQRREADLRKIDAFEKLMREYGASQNFGDGDDCFTLTKRVKLQMIDAARSRNVPIEEVCDAVRITFEAAIRSQKLGTPDLKLH